MAYFYLVSTKGAGGKPLHLAECSSPSVAIADAAKDEFQAQRVEGAVLDVLKATLTVRKIGNEPKAATPAADGTGEEQQEGQQPGATGGDGNDGKPPADDGKGAKGKGGE